MRRRPAPALLLAAILAATAAAGAAERGEGFHRLRFALETQNLELIRTPLYATPPSGLEVCPLLADDRWFGRLPHRWADELATSSEHALLFAAAYGADGPPEVLFDFDGDGRLACGEELPMVALAERPGEVLRTFTLAWPRDGGPERRQRYRLSVSARRAGAAPPEVRVEAVDVPVARWTVGDETSLWVLYDGNFNGMIDRRFGDGVLVAVGGERRLSLDREDGDLRSFHLPIELPWGRYRVAALEPEGPTLVLAPLPDAPGDAAATLSCTDPRRGEVVLGDADGRPQLVYFWLSQCGSCNADMAELGPLVERIGADRLRAVGVSFDETRAGYDAFLARHGVEEWAHCFSGRALWDNALAAELGVFDPSSFVLFDGDGREVARGVRFGPLEEALDRLLGEPRPPAAGAARSAVRRPTKGGT